MSIASLHEVEYFFLLFLIIIFRHERDVTAQTEAVNALEFFPSPTTRAALTDTIKNEHCFYKERHS